MCDEGQNPGCGRLGWELENRASRGPAGSPQHSPVPGRAGRWMHTATWAGPELDQVSKHPGSLPPPSSQAPNPGAPERSSGSLFYSQH